MSNSIMLFTNKRIDMIVRGKGWSPARSVNIDAWVAALYGNGYDITSRALGIMREFGGLSFFIDINTGLLSGTTELIFDPTRAIMNISQDEVAEWQECLNLSLTPVAAIAECGVILADRNGGIYALIMGTMYRLGRDIYSAIEEYLLASVSPWIVCDRVPRQDT